MPSRHPNDRPADGTDPWDALGAASSDDFWRDVPDWGDTASTARRTGRGRIGGADEPVDPTPIGHPVPGEARGGLVGSIRSAWDQLLTGGADTTREHRRVEVEAATPVDPYVDDAFDETPRPARRGAAEVPAVAAPFDHELDDPADAEAPATPADESPIRGIERGWMAEATHAGRPTRGPIDPLLVRLGAIVIVASLVVPLFISLAGGDDLDAAADTVTSATAPSTEVVPLDAAVPTAEPTTTEPLDPASLPPAIPVNTDPPAAESSTAATSATATAESSSASSSDTASASPVGDTAASASSTAGDESDTSGLSEVEEPAAADSPAARVDPPVCPIDYTIVAGDFWLRLADAAGVDLADLLAVNNAAVDTPLYPGSEICLPEGATTPAPPTTVATTTPPTTAPPTTAPPTTAAPTTVPPTTVAPEPPGPEDIKQIIRDVFPDELEAKALDIAYRESRYVPTAKNFCCYGLFQIYWEVHDVWLVDIGITSASQLFDPETNARAALALYERAGGWGPWSTA